MQAISEEDIRVRIARDNPWWTEAQFALPEAALPRRVYFDPFKRLALNFNVRRATVLLGPRRVGKTVMLKQLISEAFDSGVDRRGVLYVSIATPIYSGISLEKFVSLIPFQEGERYVVIFDEIQYLRDWEIH